jgi:hypothetical protein
LKPSATFSVGTVIIVPGSPGYCSIIINEALATGGEKFFSLAEGYSPAQSIYVLRNTKNPTMGAWQPLWGGSSIATASYLFKNYRLRTFE